LTAKKVDPKSKADPLAFTSRRFHSETTFTRWTVNDEDNDRLEGLPRAARRGDQPQQIADGYGTLLQVEEAKYKKPLEKQVSELSALQQLHYASNRYASLLIFQGMDAGGKDGAIRHVMSGVNPQGCQVSSFKQPSAEELEHDFLWRAIRRLPERGQVGIFNRSYYEEVLVVRVHPDLLRSQGLSEELRNEKTIWGERRRARSSRWF
jgi:polyphosphate kinase 2 (PPK2 family)